MSLGCSAPWEAVSAPRRRALTLSLGAAALLLLCGWLVWRLARLSLEARFADDQTAIIDEMRARALAGDAQEAAQCLDYAVSYYPSGTKQPRGSPLDRVVERQRAAAVRDIVAHLRRVTGEDLGEAPEPWVARYAGR
jgi:hypothetical protein